VWTGAAIGDFVADGPDIFRHGARRNHAGSVNIGRIGPAHGLDDDDVTRIDGQYRLKRRTEMSDVCGLGISVCSAARALNNANPEKNKLQKSVPILAIAFSPYLRPQ
jgi:hypothetical protein